MQDYQQRINKLTNTLSILDGEIFEPATDGTHYKVFLSNNYVIRFRDDNPELLIREADLLKQLKHPLIPTIVWVGEIDGVNVMVENRLPGKNLNTVWKTLSSENQGAIIDDVVDFLRYLKTQTKDSTYSITTGKTYASYFDYLICDIDKKIAAIAKFEQAETLLKNIANIINTSKENNLFSDEHHTTLVHGDLIIHNLLTDGKRLTGVLDWELALFADSDHDLFRLFYYQECAKAYQEQGADKTFEAEYMDQLIDAISKSDLITDLMVFKNKYQCALAIFRLNALYWAASSSNPQDNINDLVVQWGE